MEWRVEYTKDCLSFAAAELAGYLGKMGIQSAVLKSSDPLQGTIRLEIGGANLPKVDDPKLDDAYSISVSDGVGEVTGTNARSVLMGVYRLLTEMGCRWLRPGKNGEIVPKWKERELTVKLSEAASYRHRGVCIEGACSYTHVAALIDWLPKVGMNAYYNQFFVPFTFFEQWYQHRGNAYMPPEPLSLEQAEGMVNSHVLEIGKRGLLYHGVGHGWTCEPFGIEGNGWDEKDYFVPEGVSEFFAKLNGKRELFYGIPLNTNLCYSNPAVRDKVLSAIVDYLKKHRAIDYLHFWLADGWNNHCECDGCKDIRPSDLYVMMLNELDCRLTKEEIDTKIVFLLYVDLLWEPLTQKLQNQERFVLMFAPITRTYSLSYIEADLKERELAPYVRNKLTMPKDVGENIQRLRKWQKQFSGDSFVYDYHLIWDHNYDLGGYKSAHILFEDMKNLDRLGINGMVSCQVQRAFYPTGLSMYAMSCALWDKSQTFEGIAKRYYKDMFGGDGEVMHEYFTTLSELFDPPYFRKEKEAVSEESVKRFHRIYGVVNGKMPFFLKAFETESDACRKRTWQSLIIHGQLCIYMADVLTERAKGNDVLEKWEKAKDYITRMESEIHELFDVWYFIKVMCRFLGLEENNYA